MSDLMRDSLGLPMLDFTTADEKGKPPLPYADLGADERKNFIANLEVVYSTKEFQDMYQHTINHFGNHSMLVEKDDAIKNGRIAIVALKTFMQKFLDAHAEFLTNKRGEQPFDPLATLPE